MSLIASTTQRRPVAPAAAWSASCDPRGLSGVNAPTYEFRLDAGEIHALQIPAPPDL